MRELAQAVLERVDTPEGGAPQARLEDALITTSRDSLILSWNGGAERLTGYTAHEVIGKNIAFLFTAKHREIDSLNSQDAVSGIVVRNSVVKIQCKQGGQVSLIYTLVPMSDRMGRIVGLLRICKDISAFKRARSSLEQAISQLQGMDRVEDPILEAMRTHPSEESNAPLASRLDSVTTESHRSRQGFLRIVQMECDHLSELLERIRSLLQSR
ncbi:MAG: PAS domain S-box protein [Planctomycetota bacterium]